MSKNSFLVLMNVLNILTQKKQFYFHLWIWKYIWKCMFFRPSVYISCLHFCNAGHKCIMHVSVSMYFKYFCIFNSTIYLLLCFQ